MIDLFFVRNEGEWIIICKIFDNNLTKVADKCYYIFMRVLYIDVKSDMQTCLMAVAQLEIEIDACKLGGFNALKVIHGYGSHGVGGAIKKDIHTRLKQMKAQKKIKDYIPCEKWTPSNPQRQIAIKHCDELLADSDLRMLNSGVTIVLI